MMSLSEWEALSGRERNVICAETVMGLTIEKLCIDGLEPGDLEKGYAPSRCLEGTGACAKCSFLKDGGGWDICDEKYSLPVADYVTDRNATVMLLDEVERRGLVGRLGFSLAIDDVWDNEEHPHDYKWVSIDILRIDPSIIAYCAVAACEERTK